jgi:hypothetical protein
MTKSTLLNILVSLHHGVDVADIEVIFAADLPSQDGSEGNPSAVISQIAYDFEQMAKHAGVK